MNETILPLLTKDDLSSARRIMVFDSIANDFFKKRINRLAQRNVLVVILDVSSAVKNGRWFKECVRSQRVRKFVWTLFPFTERYRGDDEAFKSVEEVFAGFDRRGYVPLQPFVKLYGNKEVDLAFKKELILRLADYFGAVNAVRNLEQSGKEVIFFPSLDWREMDQWFKKIGRHNTSCGIVLCRMSSGEALGMKMSQSWKKFVGILNLLGTTPWVLSRIRKVDFVDHEPKTVQLGIRLFKESWGLKGAETHEIDWLLDGKKLNHQNTIFVAETPLYPQFEEEINKRQYQFVRQYRQACFRRVSRRFILKEILLKTLTHLVPAATRCLRAPRFFSVTCAKAWMDYLRWQAFIERWVPKNYFTYNDLIYTQIFRNLILEKVGCQTWFFDHSNSKPQMYDMGKEVCCRDAIRAYRRFDQEIHWGRQHIAIALNQYNRSRSLTAYGPLWSQDVKYHARLDALLQERWRGMPKGVMIAAFSTANSETATNGEDAHLRFLLALKKLLNSPRFPDLKILFKPKGLDYEASMSAEGRELSSTFQYIKDHARVIMIDPFVSASATMFFVDLTLTMAFASPTIEALMAGRRAVYYEPCFLYPNSFFERFPNLIARDEEQLIDLISHWTAMPAPDFQSYLEKYLWPEYGGKKEKEPIVLIQEALSR